MATETVRLPNGETVEVRVPDGLDAAQTAQFLQQAIPRIQAQMEPRDTPQPSPEETGPEIPARIQGRRSVRDMDPMESRIEAVRGGLGSALFGVDVPISAAVANLMQRLQGENVPFQESLEFARGRKQAIREMRPAEDVAGLAAGTVPAVAAAVPRQAARLGTSGIERLRSFITGGPAGSAPASAGAPSGGRLAELGRASATGAAAGGSQTLMEEGDASTGAVVGGAAGPAAVLGTRAVAALPGVGERVRNFVVRDRRSRESIAPGFRALARRINTDPDVLASRFEQMRRDLGRPPAMAELLDDLDAQSVQQMGRLVPRRIGQPLREAAEQRAVARQAETAAAVRGGRRDVTPESARVARRNLSDVQFGAFADQPITVDQELRDFLEDPNTQAAISGGRTGSGRETVRELRSRVLRALDDPNETITAQDLEDIRQAATVPAVQEEARAILTSRVPDAEAALTASSRRAQRIEGIETGGPLLLSGRAPSPVPGGREQDLGDVVARGRAPEQAGVRRGARTALARRAETSPSGARSTVRSVAQDEGLGNRLDEIFQPSEAQRIRRFARAEERAARSIEGTAGTTGIPLEEQAVGLAATASQVGTLGGAARGELIQQLANIANLPLLSARRVATALTDPARAEEAIALLRSRRIGDEAIREILDTIAATAGITATAAEER